MLSPSRIPPLSANSYIHPTLQIIGIKVLLYISSYFVNLDQAGWDDALVNGLDLVANHVLQTPLFLMTLMRYLTPTLDDMYVSVSLLTAFIYRLL
jgi:hypothetical protein